MSTVVSTERDARVLIVTINRPEKRNALNTEVRDALMETLAAAANEDAIHALIITGAGDRAFIAGADIHEFAERTADEQEQAMRQGNVFAAVDRFPKPIIAAINGYCFGGGVEIAMACDIRLAAESATFGQPEISLGLIPGGGATQRLPRLVGTGHALRLILTGAPIDAAEALRIGLVDQVVPQNTLLASARALAHQIASKSPIATRAAKEAVKAAAQTTLDDGLQVERTLYQLCFASEDRHEGVRAFLEKRPPRFVGR